MYVIKCGNYEYDSPKMVKLCEPYMTVKELIERHLKRLDPDEPIVIDTVGAYFRNIEEIEEVGE